MAKKQVTFADIAEYTGFSKTTISRYFNHPDSLTLENQEKIAKALDELGYRKNKLARVLANGKSEFVGIIVPNLYLHYYSEMLTQLLRSYSDYHYKFLVFVSDGGPEKEMQYLDELMAYKIEVDINVGIKFLHGHLIPSGFQKAPKRRCGNSFSQTGNNSTCYKNILYCHLRFPPPFCVPQQKGVRNRFQGVRIPLWYPFLTPLSVIFHIKYGLL